MHSPHPNHPKNVSVSLRNIEERIAQMTTERAPRGVFAGGDQLQDACATDGMSHTTTMASTNAYAMEQKVCQVANEVELTVALTSKIT
jgi:hypothetical protein